MARMNWERATAREKGVHGEPVRSMPSWRSEPRRAHRHQWTRWKRTGVLSSTEARRCVKCGFVRHRAYRGRRASS